MGTSCLAGQSGGIQKVHCSVITTDKFSSPEVFRTPLDYEGEPAGRKVSGQVQLDLSLSCNQKGMVYSAIGPYHLGRVSNKECVFAYNPINLYKKWTEATLGNNVSIHGDGNLGDLLYFRFDFHSHLRIFYHSLINVVMNKYYIDSYDNDIEISICDAIHVIWLDPGMVHTRKSSEGEYSLMSSYGCTVALWRFCDLPFVFFSASPTCPVMTECYFCCEKSGNNKAK